jgi:hypothetical protein
MVRRSKVFVLNSPTDALRLPTSFDRRAFTELFATMFQASDVEVFDLPHTIWIFTKVMDDYEREKTTGNQLVSLF